MVQFDCKGIMITLRDRKRTDRSEELIDGLTAVWESSVRATHFFLTEEKIVRIGRYVPQALCEVPHLVVAEREGVPVAFAGIEGHRLEMLFVSAGNRGKGIGKRLVQYAVERYGVSELAVNEQNPQAIGFYEHMGFSRCGRSDVDGYGDPIPVLYMKK